MKMTDTIYWNVTIKDFQNARLADFKIIVSADFQDESQRITAVILICRDETVINRARCLSSILCIDNDDDSILCEIVTSLI